MGGIPIVTMLSQVTGLPTTFIRNKPKSYGTCRYAEGASLTGRSFVLIEDVVSSGGALLDTLSMLKADGLRPVGVARGARTAEMPLSALSAAAGPAPR